MNIVSGIDVLFTMGKVCDNTDTRDRHNADRRKGRYVKGRIRRHDIAMFIQGSHVEFRNNHVSTSNPKPLLRRAEAIVILTHTFKFAILQCYIGADIPSNIQDINTYQNHPGSILRWMRRMIYFIAHSLAQYCRPREKMD